MTTLEAAPAHEADFLARELAARDYHLGAIIANRILPPALTRRGAATSAKRLGAAADDGAFVGHVATVLRAAGDGRRRRRARRARARSPTRFHDVALVATREAERRAELAELAPEVLDVPSLDTDIHDLARPARARRCTCATDDVIGQTRQSMAHLAALVRDNTTLDRDQVSHLNRLTSEWGMLADFCFADLLLYVPTKDDRWLIVGQVRPATGQTVYHTDWVGAFANVSEQSVLASPFTSGEITEGDVKVEDLTDSARMLAVPVRCGGRADRRPDPRVGAARRPPAGRAGADLPRHLRPLRRDDRRGLVPVPDARRRLDGGAPGRRRRDEPRRRRPGALPVAERQLGAAPRRHPRQRRRHAPRRARVPRRHGPQGLRARRSRSSRSSSRRPTSPCCAAACRSCAGGEVAGGVLLVRDVTDLRKRDRLLISKDATIREIHHRVKNNLQTISSLLRLQARRLENPEAKAAVSESVRRIRTIALVHESLSREPGDDVTFIEIVRPLLRLAEESLQSPDRPVQFSLSRRRRPDPGPASPRRCRSCSPS